MKLSAFSALIGTSSGALHLGLPIALLLFCTATPAQTVTEIIDSSANGLGNTLSNPDGVATDASGNVYVTGTNSDNAFRIAPDGTITRIINETGDGLGNTLDYPQRVATDPAGNVYVTGTFSDNAFRIAPDGTITEIIDASGDGLGNTLDDPRAVATDDPHHLPRSNDPSTAVLTRRWDGLFSG